MKVCFVGESFNMLSGTSKPMFELAQELSKKGIDVTILTTEPPLNIKEVHNRLLKEKKIRNIKLIPVPNLSKTLLFGRGEQLQFIRDILADSDIIHGVDFLTLYAVQRLLSESKFRPPILYSLTGCYKLHIKYLLNSGVESFLNMAKPVFSFKFLCPNIVFKKIFNSFDKIISTSNFMTNDLCLHGISREKVGNIPVGIDIEPFDGFNSKTSEIPTSYDFLYFGWGSSIRGVPDVVKAFSMVLRERPNAKLALFFLGSHGIEEKLHGYLIQKNKNFKSIVLNIGANSNIFDIIQTSNAVVLPFRSPFGYSHPPLTVLESMLLRKPVISTYVGSVPEVISNGKTGFLVRPKDINTLAQKMLLTYDRELSDRVGKQAQAYVMKTHNIKEVAKKTVHVYDEIIGGN